MGRINERQPVTLMRPAKGGMRDEVAVILAVLAGWGVATFGSQGVVLLCKKLGGCTTTGLALFHLPLHFFFTAQFLPLWFIVLCLIFNVYLDRLTAKHSRKRDRTYE